MLGCIDAYPIDGFSICFGICLNFINIFLLVDNAYYALQGNILYRFPSLQRTASSQRSGRKEYVGRIWADWVGGVEKFFNEKKLQFRFFVIFSFASYVVKLFIKTMTDFSLFFVVKLACLREQWSLDLVASIYLGLSFLEPC